jgi:hypothetical protein
MAFASAQIENQMARQREPAGLRGSAQHRIRSGDGHSHQVDRYALTNDRAAADALHAALKEKRGGDLHGDIVQVTRFKLRYRQSGFPLNLSRALLLTLCVGKADLLHQPVLPLMRFAVNARSVFARLGMRLRPDAPLFVYCIEGPLLFLQHVVHLLQYQYEAANP